jgi:DNA polymerase III, gamma/tau subunits
MRHLKEIAQYKPLRGNWRVFLIDHIDRANEQAANSLLKTLEEPPAHLVIVMTAENAYDLLPTIRSRAVIFQMNPLSVPDMDAFSRRRGLHDGARRLALASGSPGVALSLDLEAYDKRRAAMLALLQVASSRAPFAKWTKYSESIGASKSEKLEYYLKVLYVLLEDLLILHQTRGEIRNPDLRNELEALLPGITFEWLYSAVRKVDELAELLRRNIQKSIALDALILSLRAKRYFTATVTRCVGPFAAIRKLRNEPTAKFAGTNALICHKAVSWPGELPHSSGTHWPPPI